MKRLGIILAILVATAAAWAAVGPVGSWSATSSTDSITRSYGAMANHLEIYPWVADVEVIITPLRATTNDTFTFRAGVRRHLPIRHDGFTIIRSTATAVDVSWWQ